ncbi:MAG: hypothetical protein HRF49_02350 [bacterium]
MIQVKTRLEAYQEFLERPIAGVARVILFISVFSVIWVFREPLWTMSFESNQYPDPLKMAIHINHLEGQKTEMRDDLREINSLNHYIGMRPLLESDFSEFLWLPFAVGFFVIVILRALVLGNLRDLVDIFVLYTYFGLFSAWTFYNRLYQCGHNLSPEAPIKIEPFTPPIYGRVKVANFWVESFPGGGSYALAAFGAMIFLAFAVALLMAWRRARRERKAAAPGA